jgi:hypothetical protein
MAWKRSLELILQDADMSAQWKSLPSSDQLQRGTRAVAECRTNRWPLEVRQCYVQAKTNADLARCEHLRGQGRAAHALPFDAGS